MRASEPTAVQVTLRGGPCDGQIINVYPRGGLMPYTVEVLRPFEQWADVVPVPDDYHTYVRHGTARDARRYIHITEVTPRARHASAD